MLGHANPDRVMARSADLLQKQAEQERR